MLDENGELEGRLNTGHVKTYPVADRQKDELYRLLEMHGKATGSAKAAEILQHFDEYLPKFRAVISDEYLKYMQQ